MRAFSLTELMVVIAIVAVLAVLAVPAYHNYIIRAKIATGISILNDINDAMKTQYAKGTLNNTFDYDGVSFVYGITNQYLPYVAGDVALIEYDPPNSFPGLIGDNQFGGCVYLANLDNISDSINTVPYVSPQGTDRGQRSRLCFITTEQNGIYKTSCGIYSSGAPGSGAPGQPYDIPPDYLPSGCNDKFMD